MSIKPGRRRQRGLTLIELIIFMVIISVALAAVLQLLNLSTKFSVDPLRRKQALLLAEGLLEEVQLAGFTYCDPSDPKSETATAATAAQCDILENVGHTGGESGNTRPFDNVNDYVTAYASPQSTEFNKGTGAILYDAAGNVLAGSSSVLPGYSATLSIVATDTLNDITSTAAPAGNNVLRITVSVTYGTNATDVVVMDGYRTRYSPTVGAQ